MEIQLYLQILRRGWWVIVLTALVALAAALTVTYFITPQYETVARFIVTPSNALVNRGDVLYGLNTLGGQSVTATYVEVMNSDRVYSDALASLQIQYAEVKDYTYEASVVATSSVLELRVKGTEPKMTVKLANAIGYQTINFTRQLNQVFNVDFLDAAYIPTEPVSPRPLLNAILSILGGLVVGASIVILTEQFRLPLETIRQQLQYDQITGVYKSKYFLELLDEELAQHLDSELSIGVVRLNGIRDLGETIPFVSLQRILQRTTDALKKELRGNDVIGRWDENSFVIMLPNTAGMAAKSIFDRIFKTLSQPIELVELNMNVKLEPHIGGAEYSNEISTQELFEKVDAALEQARRFNANRVCVWELKNPFWTQPINE